MRAMLMISSKKKGGRMYKHILVMRYWAMLMISSKKKEGRMYIHILVMGYWAMLMLSSCGARAGERGSK